MKRFGYIAGAISSAAFFAGCDCNGEASSETSETAELLAAVAGRPLRWAIVSSTNSTVCEGQLDVLTVPVGLEHELVRWAGDAISEIAIRDTSEAETNVEISFVNGDRISVSPPPHHLVSIRGADGQTCSVAWSDITSITNDVSD